MLDINEINAEIEKLEQCTCTSYSVCEKLAILYTVRDHYKGSTTNRNGNGTVIAPPEKI